MLLSLRGTQSSVKRQGDRPTCVSFAVTALHEHAYDVLLNTMKTAQTDLSEEFLHHHCKKHDGLAPNANGTTVAAASISLQVYGQPLETLCPYVQSLVNCGLSAPTLDAYKDAKTRLLPGLKRVPTSIASISNCLSQVRPLVGLLDWYSNAYTASSGNIGMPGHNDRYLGRHAILIVELEQKRKVEDCRVTFKNSWGAKWGDMGFGYFGFEYFTTHGRELWAVTP